MDPPTKNLPDILVKKRICKLCLRDLIINMDDPLFSSPIEFEETHMLVCLQCPEFSAYLFPNGDYTEYIDVGNHLIDRIDGVVNVFVNHESIAHWEGELSHELAVYWRDKLKIYAVFA